jgi:myosin heavy subunit
MSSKKLLPITSNLQEVDVDVDKTTAAVSRQQIKDEADFHQKVKDAEYKLVDCKNREARGEYASADAARKAKERARKEVRDAKADLEEVQDDNERIREAREKVDAAYKADQREQHGKDAAQAARRAVEGAAKLREQVEAAMQQREAVVREFRTALSEARKAGVEVSNMSSGSVMQVLDNYLPHLADKTRPEVNVPSITRPEADIGALLGGVMADHGEKPEVQTAQPENQAKPPQPRKSKADILAENLGRQPTDEEIERAQKVGPYKAARLVQEEQPQADVSEPEDVPGPVGGARRKQKGAPEGVGTAGLGVSREAHDGEAA